MPRASGSGKRQSGAAGQRDTRHENGLVGPATTKRVVGKKSQAQLDASAQGAARSAADLSPGQARLPCSPPRKGASAAAQSLTNGVSKHHGESAADGRTFEGSCSDETSSESGGSHLGSSQIVDIDAGHRQIDVNAMKNVDVHRDSGPLELAATVLKALPMQDTLAILIILMHVPAVSLTFIYTIFAVLTFVPPVTTSSGMNINFAEILDGMATTPSPITLLCMDVLFILFWLFLWQPLQEVMLDLAKPVIAITLGGGTGARDGTSRGLTTCFIWVMLHHLLRGTQSHWARLVRHIPDNWPVPAVLHEPFKLHAQDFEVKGFVAWMRSLLAVHILTQGIIRHIKEWYLRREKFGAGGSTIDPEAGKSAAGTGDGTMADAGHTATDAEPSTQQVHGSSSASKKRRKQSTQVRLQQPLWAALASTKIVVMKEYELSNNSREQVGSNATDVHNLGNAPFESQERQIWISYVGSDEVCFNTSLFPDDDSEPEPASTPAGEAIPTSTKSPERPFFVRVNNAYWQPTRMFPVDAGEETEEEQQGTRWTGDIYGLRPASKYVCEFVERRTEKVLFKTSIRTVHEPQRDAESGASAVPNDQRSLRPDSPATTLKTSIAAAEARLGEEKNRLKTARKEWKTRINNLKKDIELTDNQLASAGNHDEKYKQKIRQQETQKSQAERDTVALADQLKNFDSAPELTERKKKVERLYAGEKKLYDGEKKEFEDFKAKLVREVKAKELEHSNLVSKVNKIRMRINKVETELANITDANNRGLDEAERRRQERAHWHEHTAGIESNYRERLTHIRATNAGKIGQIRAMEAQLAALVNGGAGPMSMDLAGDFQQQPPGAWNPNPAAPPHIPVSIWAGSTADMMPSVTAVSGGPSTWQPPPTAPAFEPRPMKTRGRSSSMLSDVSGFTQSSDEEPSPMPIEAQNLWRHFGRGPLRPHSSGGSGGGSMPTSPT
ncbi:hypothetical protein ACO1O0_003611 [Amphichorda felina]